MKVVFELTQREADDLLRAEFVPSSDGFGHTGLTFALQSAQAKLNAAILVAERHS